MRWKYSLLVLFTVFGGIPALAETDSSKQCDEAWLSHSWPTVAVQCSDSASQRSSSIADRQAEVQVAIDRGALQAGDAYVNASGPSDAHNLLALEKSAIQGTFFIAAIEEARSAVAYHRLHRNSQAGSELGMAKYYANNSLKFGDPDEQKDVNSLMILLNSPKFFNMNPDDMTLLQ
jgi:hypothetical protein